MMYVRIHTHYFVLDVCGRSSGIIPTACTSAGSVRTAAHYTCAHSDRTHALSLHALTLIRYTRGIEVLLSILKLNVVDPVISEFVQSENLHHKIVIACCCCARVTTYCLLCASIVHVYTYTQRCLHAHTFSYPCILLTPIVCVLCAVCFLNIHADGISRESRENEANKRAVFACIVERSRQRHQGGNTTRHQVRA